MSFEKITLMLCHLPGFWRSLEGLWLACYIGFLPSIGELAYILHLTFFRQFGQIQTLFFCLERFYSNTTAGDHTWVKKKKKTVKHNLKLCKKISSSSSFYHKYFANILYSFYNKTGNLAQFTEYSQHKKWIQVKKKLNVVCS